MRNISESKKIYNAITDVFGISVGHATDPVALTGCTVILCEDGAVAGVDVRGSAPGTRETDAIQPTTLIEKVHAILLTGGSAFGLDASAGVMQFLEEKGFGYPVGSARVPIVPAAVVFDLNTGDGKVRPDKKMGYMACLNATSQQVNEGNVGAGTGATVGKAFGQEMCMKSGVGTASIQIAGQNNVTVGSIVVVNALGDVIDPNTGEIIAGAHNPETGEFLDTVTQMLSPQFKQGSATANTTIGVIATDAKLSKAEATKVAQMAHDGLARTIRPIHTMFDGDTIFALSTGSLTADVNVIGTVGAQVMAEAILRAVKSAKSADGIKGLADD